MSEYISFQRMFQQLDFPREKMSWYRVSINVGRGLCVGEGVKGEWFSGKNKAFRILELTVSVYDRPIPNVACAKRAPVRWEEVALGRELCW